MYLEKTNHAIRQTIKRCKEISNGQEASAFIDKHFSGMFDKEFYENNKIVIGKGRNDTFFISNGNHKFIYSFNDNDDILIITYMKVNKSKKKQSKWRKILDIIFA